MHVCTHIHTHTHIYMHRHVHAHVHTHTENASSICSKRDARDIGVLMLGTDFQYSD